MNEEQRALSLAEQLTVFYTGRVGKGPELALAAAITLEELVADNERLRDLLAQAQWKAAHVAVVP